MDWTRRINRALQAPKCVDEIFAFVYFMWSHEEGGEEVRSCLGKDQSSSRDHFKSEVCISICNVNKWKGWGHGD